ncbi:hypothetical protein CR513_36383, partial [Mucuna pruriens]
MSVNIYGHGDRAKNSSTAECGWVVETKLGVDSREDGIENRNSKRAIMAIVNAIPGNLPVFDGKGYEDWCVKMDAILGFQELDEIVKDGFQEPSKNASAE